MKRLLLSLVSVLLLSSPLMAQGTSKSDLMKLPWLGGTVNVYVDNGPPPEIAQSGGTIVLNLGNALTITVTAAQHAKLTRLLTYSNTARAANGQAAQTLEQWLRDKLVETVQAEIRTAEAHEQAEACAAYLALTQAKRNAIDAELGGKSPCR